jgi:predicted HicB family RNase H-like nuclease
MTKPDFLVSPVTFEGETVEELRTAFHYVVNEHVKDCKAENVLVDMRKPEANKTAFCI